MPNNIKYSSQIEQQFSVRFEELKSYENKDPVKYAELATKLVQDINLSKFEKLKILVKLTGCLADFKQADAYRERAEAVWKVLRRWHVQGRDKEIDNFLDDYREKLNRVKLELFGQEDVEMGGA